MDSRFCAAMRRRHPELIKQDKEPAPAG
jgi:hypothetical protein